MKHKTKTTEAIATAELDVCAGYQRQPHTAPIVLEFQHIDGHKTGLCRICANRWLLSDEEFPPKEETRKKPKPLDVSNLPGEKAHFEDKTSIPATNKIAK